MKVVVFKGTDLPSVDTVPARSLQKGVIANFLNPSPYLFWISIGAPLIVNAWREGPIAAFSFIFIFYALLVGSKVAIALAVGKSRNFFKEHPLYFCHPLPRADAFYLCGLLFQKRLHPPDASLKSPSRHSRYCFLSFSPICQNPEKVCS